MRFSFTGAVLLLLAASVSAQEQGDDDNAPLPEGRLTLTIDPGRHTARVQRIFFDPADANQLISLADDGAVRLWDAAEMKSTRVVYLPGLPMARSAALSKDGKRLAVVCRRVAKGNYAYIVCLLSLPEGRLERVLPAAQVWTLAFSPDGQRLAAAYDGIWLADLTQEKPMFREVRKGKSFTGVAFSPDGKRIAAPFTVMRPGPILDLETGQELGTIQGSHVAWSSDGTKIVTTGGKFIRIHDDKGNLLHETTVEGGCTSLSLSPDSKSVLFTWDPAGTHLNRSTLLDMETGKERLKLPFIVFSSGASAFSADGQFAATAGGINDNVQILVWQTGDGAIHRQIKGMAWIGGGAAFEIPAWSKDGKRACWISWQRGAKAKNPKLGQATFDLAELDFGPSLTKEQRYEFNLDKDGVMEKDGLTLKRKDGSVIVFKDGKQIRRYGPCEAASLLGNNLVAVRHRADSTTVNNVVTGQGGRISPDGRYLLRIILENQKLTMTPVDQTKPLLTLYRNGQDWIIWTEEGYYAETTGGERLIVWKVDNGIDKLPSVHAADRFRRQLHRPEVIKKAFELGSVRAALKELDGAGTKVAELEELLPPKVTLTLVDSNAKGEAKFKATATAAVKSQPVTTLRLMLDGRPLPDSKLTLRFDPGREKVEAEFTVSIPEGKHTLIAFVRSPDASSASEPITVDNVAKANLPMMHVLAIGINDYKERALRLESAKNDAQAIARTFKALNKGNLFREVYTEEILDQQANRKHVLSRMEAARQRAIKSPNDLVVIFFAGHGIKKKDSFYLLTQESDLDQLEGTSLSGEDLRKALGEFPCQVILMMDACNSAGFGTGKKLSKMGLRPATDEVARTLTDNDVGVVVFCAAMGHEKAQEKGGKDGHGLFTKALMDALTKEEDVPFNKVTRLQYLHHVHSHVFDLVSAWSDERQHPFLNLPWTTESRALRELPKR